VLITGPLEDRGASRASGKDQASGIRLAIAMLTRTSEIMLNERAISSALTEEEVQHA
jgi:hypothetical protein